MSSAPPRRVLVVEDELAIRELLRLHLRHVSDAMRPGEPAAPGPPGRGGRGRGWL